MFNYDEFKQIVATNARIQYGKTICIDSIEESYKEYRRGNITIEDAVNHVIAETAYWDGEF